MKLSLIAVVVGREIDRVEGFDDLGTSLNKHGGAEDDLDSHLGKLQQHLTNWSRCGEVFN